MKVANGSSPYGYVASCAAWAPQAFASPSLWCVSDYTGFQANSNTNVAIREIARPFKHFSGRISPAAGMKSD